MVRLPRIDRHLACLLYISYGLLLLSGAHCQSAADAANTTSTTSTSVSPSTAPTTQEAPPLPIASGIQICPSRTINYITHTLPQKCLKANWTGLANHTIAQTDASQGEGIEINGTYVEGGVIGDVQTGSIAEPPIPSPTIDAHIPEETAVPQTDAPELAEAGATDSDSESPLDNAKFLSFEEWKIQNLEKAAQAADGQPKNLNPGNIADALESVGKDSQLDIDFEGFGAPKPIDQDATASPTMGQQPQEEKAKAPSTRKKEAGTTSKERFNYASFDCAASILKTNPKCKSPSSILVENKDSYMLNECSIDNKFLIVELCNDILVDTVVLANFEFFSSMFRTFRISVSDRYPVKLDAWKELGTFEARNAREMQAFAIGNPQAFVKYLRVEFLSHYGSEYYCPVSLLRVHGTTMIEDLRNQDSFRVDEEEDVIAEATVATPPPSSTSDTVAVNAETKTSEIGKRDIQASNTSAFTSASSETTSTVLIDTDDTVSVSSTSISSVSTTVSTSAVIVSSTSTASNNQSIIDVVSTTSIIANVSHVSGSEQTQISTTVVDKSTTEVSKSSSATESTSTQSIKDSTSSSTSTTTVASSVSVAKVASQEPVKQSQAPPPPAPSPTTQDNIFKSIQKRLQMLEANATLSLQYIEEQSRILRDAFTIVEKRQLTKTEDFLKHLNDSVITELKTFRQQYDQLWQSTVLELEAHREQYQRELIAVTSRLTIVADELLFQKRMAIVQSTLVMLCIGLVLFVRSGSSTLELPLMQQVLSKSHSVLGLQFESPTGSTRGPGIGVEGSFPASPASKDGSPQRLPHPGPTIIRGGGILPPQQHRLARVRSAEDFADDEDGLDEDARIINVVEPEMLMDSPSPTLSLSSSPPSHTNTTLDSDDLDHAEADSHEEEPNEPSISVTPTQTPSRQPTGELLDLEIDGTDARGHDAYHHAGNISSPILRQGSDLTSSTLSSRASTPGGGTPGISGRVAALKKRAGNEDGSGFPRSMSGPATPRGSRDLPERSYSDVEWEVRMNSRESTAIGDEEMSGESDSWKQNGT